jgi:phosphoglycerate-specific signal transduction histidine kinase
MDTPNLPPPLDPRERPVLESLRVLRDQLTLLKQDRTTYVKSSDVMPLYDKVVEQVKLLTDIRADKATEDNQGSAAAQTDALYILTLSRPVDRVLDGCFQLLSLFFMTIGRNNEAPAAYALTSTIKRLLDHLVEVDIYSEKDLAHISQTLERLREMVKTASSSYSENFITLLSNRIEVCQRSLVTLNTRLARLSDEIMPTYEKLISILRSLSLANTKSKVCHIPRKRTHKR